MLTEKGTLNTEVIFNESKTERYLLRKVWDDKPIVSLIMTNPSIADVVSVDMTTLYVINNLYRLGEYGGVDILNMTSQITSKVDTKNGITLSDVNAEYILKSCETSDKVILAFGRIGENSKKIRHVIMKLLDTLTPFQDKLYMIASDAGDCLFHPLAPQVRFSWHLIPFVPPEYLQEKPESKPENQASDKSEDKSENQWLKNLEERSEDESEKSTDEKPARRTRKIS